MDGVKHKGTNLRKVSFEKNNKIVWISIITFLRKLFIFETSSLIVGNVNLSKSFDLRFVM